jgi:hypothetical protein
MKLSKDILGAFLIILLLNANLANTLTSSKIGNAMRLQNKKVEKETLKNNKKKDFGITLMIIGIVLISLAITAFFINGANAIYQREVIKKISKNQLNLFELNLEICSSSTLSNLRLRSTLATKIFSMELGSNAISSSPNQAAGLELEQAQTDQVLKYYHPDVSAEDKASFPLFNKTNLRAFLEQVGLFSDKAKSLKILEKSAEDICAYYTTSNTLEDVQNTIKESYDSYSLKDEIFDVLSIICNIVNDIGMIMVGKSIQSEWKNFASGNVYRYINGANATMQNIVNFFSTLATTDVSNTDGGRNLILQTLGYFITNIWSICYMFANDTVAAVMEIIASVVAIAQTVMDFKSQPNKTFWDWSKLFENLAPSFRTIVADIPNAFLGGSDRANEVCGIIALVLDSIQVLLKLVNSIGGVYATYKQSQEAQKAYKEINAAKLIEQCEVQNNYLEYILKIKETDSSDRKLLENKSINISGETPLNTAVRKSCQTSLLTCLEIQYNSLESAGKIFSDQEYKDLAYNFRRGPIQNIIISRSFQYDDDFFKHGFKVATRDYMNMNNVMFCKGCKNNVVISHMCLYGRGSPQTLKCYHHADKANNSEIQEAINDTIAERKKPGKLQYKDDKIKDFTLKVLRIMYNYDLIYLTKEIELEEQADVKTITGLSKLIINTDKDKPQLNLTFFDFTYTIKKNLVFYVNPSDRLNLAEMKKQTLLKVEGKFKNMFNINNDPLTQMHNDFCEKTCINLEPRYEEFGCARRFYNHYIINEIPRLAEFNSRIKILRDYCTTCKPLSIAANHEQIMDNQQINNEHDINKIRSLNGKFSFHHNIETDSLQLLDLDYQINNSPFKVIAEIKLKCQTSAKDRKIICELDITQAVVCKYRDGEKFVKCYQAIQSQAGHLDSSHSIITTPHFMVHDHGVVTIIFKDTYKLLWKFGDERIKQSWLEPGEYAEKLPKDNFNLAVYKKYGNGVTDSLPDKMVSRCFFSDRYIFKCQARKQSWYTIGLEKFFKVTNMHLDIKGVKTGAKFIDNKTQNTINGKKYVKWLEGSRLINQRDGHVVLRNYKGKQMWSLFDDDDVKRKSTAKKLPQAGSRLVLKNQKNNGATSNSEASLCVYKFNGTTNERILEIAEDLDPSDINNNE